MFLPYLKNPFSSSRISRFAFRDLMQGTLTRMAGLNEGGRYTALISALQPHYDAYAALLGDQDQHLNERYGDADAVGQVLADFKAFAKNELLVDVAYVFGRKAPDDKALTAFLPRGRKEYSNATLATLPTLLDRAATLTAAHQQALGAALAARAAALQQAYQAAGQERGESQGEVQGDSAAERKLRKAAARQLKLNLLTQLTLHIDAPDEVRALYDPGLFTPAAKAPRPAKPGAKSPGTGQ